MRSRSNCVEEKNNKEAIIKMNRVVNCKGMLSILIAFALVVAFATGVALSGSSPHAYASGNTTKSAFCQNLGKTYQASSGLQAYCHGPQPSGPGNPRVSPSTSVKNVDAANPHEDVNPAGAQTYGQSETSIAAVGPYTVEAWNDATGFFSPCPSPMHKEELTGYGFSANGGSSFTDEGGLPNNNCSNDAYFGDPSVEAWRSGGTAYFYVSSLFLPSFTAPDQRTHIAMAACKATGTGTSALISCSQPIIVASSSVCTTQSGFTFCGMLDKDFLSIDPVHGRLYATYTEFVFNPTTFQQTITVDLAVCDIGTSTGGTGPAGGTAGAPVCFNGGRGSLTHPAAPYFVVAPSDPQGCENEGAYPAVDVKNGDVYVAYEHNWATSFFLAACASSSKPIQNVMNYVPFSCLNLAPTSPCGGPKAVNAVTITSLELANIPGYNRFPMNDFPRLAVSDKFGTVSMIWNDARLHPVGDILMQSFNLVSLTGVQTAPVRVNSSTGGWHFLPALRNADAAGLLDISFYGRSSPTTALTNVYVAINVDPRRSSAVTTNSLVTDVASNWVNVSSDIFPNFGDYTDNYIIATPSAPYVGETLYVAWSDGRIGVPQPFEAHEPS